MDILRIIGLLLIVITIVCIFLVGCILLFPIRYEIFSEKYSTFKVDIKVWWLEGILKAHYVKKTNEGKRVRVKLLWWNIYEEMAEYEKKEPDDSLLEQKKSETIEHKTKINAKTEKVLDGLEQLGKGVSYEVKEQTVVKDSFGIQDIPLSKELFESIKVAIHKLWNHIKPHKVYLKGKYGFEDPSYTGYVYAGFSMIYPFIEADLLEVEPDFEQSILEGDLKLKGSLLLGTLLKICIITVWKKPIRNIIQIYIKNRKKG